MSKQSEAKSSQKYDPKPTHAVCANCAHYTSDKSSTIGWGGQIFEGERCLRCVLGGFAVKKGGTCSMHEFKS